MAGLSPALAALIKGAKQKYDRNTSRTYKIKEGKTTVRILQVGDEKFWADLGVHWIKMEKNGKPVAVVGCHDVCYEAPCPIDTAIEKAMLAAVDDDAVAIIKDWKVRKSVLVNALIRKGDDASDEPVILEIKPSTFSNIMSIAEEYGEEVGNIFDTKNGIDLVIERKGKGLDTEYSVMPAPTSKAVPAEALKKLHNLDDYIAKEFFRGDEKKALTAIANYTGIDVSGIAGPSTATKRLTSATVEEADEERPTPKLTPKASPKAAAVVEEEAAPFKADASEDAELEDILSDLENL
jgi:hypothetical protein